MIDMSQELLRELLRADPAQRMTAKAVHEHRWCPARLVQHAVQAHQVRICTTIVEL